MSSTQTPTTNLQTNEINTAISSSFKTLENEILEKLMENLEKDTVSLTSRLTLEDKDLKFKDNLEKDRPIEKSKTIDSIASSVFDRLVDTLEKVSPNDSDTGQDSAICRICYGTDMQHLLSICQCKGSIAYVHLECIERWLQECGVDTCDLCKYKFITVRKPTQSKLKSLLTWMKHEDNEEDMDELLSDFAATFIFSPFIVVLTLSGYHTIVNNSMAIINSEEVVFSLSGTLSTLSLFTVVSLVNSIGFSWICYIGQKHYSRWNAWYRKLTTVSIVLPDEQVRR